MSLAAEAGNVAPVEEYVVDVEDAAIVQVEAFRVLVIHRRRNYPCVGGDVRDVGDATDVVVQRPGIVAAARRARAVVYRVGADGQLDAVCELIVVVVVITGVA